MKELSVYDATLATYYQTHGRNLLPLSSWEFYAEHSSYLASCKDDLEQLYKITQKWDFDQDYTNQLIGERAVIVITNTDLQIVYATQNITQMNGYTPQEIIGSSPKMFQGVDTCLTTAKTIRDAVSKQLPFEVSILNYKKDDSTYMCQIKGFPVRNKKGKLVNYIAFEQAA